jgi:hypothetical protein
MWYSRCRERPASMRPGGRGTAERRPRCRTPRPRSRPRARASRAGCRPPCPGIRRRPGTGWCLSVGRAWSWKRSSISVTPNDGWLPLTEPLDAPATRFDAAAAQQLCTTNPHEPPHADRPALVQCPARRGFVVSVMVGIPRWPASGQKSDVEVSQEPRGGLRAPGSVDRDRRPGWCEAAG